MTFALASLLAACGGGDDQPEAGADDHNRADVTFASNMIPHHAQAVEMADLASTRARSPQVVDLATQIKKAQQPEIDTMTGWLMAWDEPVPDPDSMYDMGHDMSSDDMSGMDSTDGMEGMMSAADMERLASASGRDFDTQWLSMMIEHHQGAIDMAKTELADGNYAQMTSLAKDIISAQQGEIATMNQLLDDLAN